MHAIAAARVAAEHMLDSKVIATARTAKRPDTNVSYKESNNEAPEYERCKN